MDKDKDKKASHPRDMQHQQHEPGKTGRSGGSQHDDPVGKDTDNDGRVVKPGHKAGDVDGPRSKSVGKDTDNDGRVVKPGHKPGEIDGSRSRARRSGRAVRDDGHLPNDSRPGHVQPGRKRRYLQL